MKISVVIPLYNKRDTISKAINSILNQIVQPDEIIVVNDGSTDGSELVVTEINHTLVKLIQQPNAGVSAARNTGIGETKCDWIAFLDADDEWMPEYLETIMSLSKKYPQCSVLATSYLNQDHSGARKRITLNKLPFKDEDGLLSNYFEVSSCSHPPLWSSAITIKKSALQHIKCFPVDITSGEDLLTWARLAIENDIAYSVKAMAVYVQNDAHTYNDKPSRIPEIPDKVGEDLAILACMNKKVPGIKDYVVHWHKMRASVFLRLGRKKDTMREILKSVSFKHFNSHLYAYLILLFLPVSFVNYIFKKFGNP